MQVDVNITRMDLVRINLFLWPHIITNWILMAVVFVMVVVITVSTLDDFVFSDLSLIAFMAGLWAIAASGLGFAICLASVIFTASAKNGLGAHHYELDENGLRESTELNEEFSKWANFDRAWKSKRYIILKRHWAAVHIFPARCFATQARFDEFYAAIAAKISGGKPDA